ncbi:MAG: 1-phosphofructokinase [Deltaproteobacteria bacterium]|nr:1-phosphofructokinase [Deltaproteobacteria bacterium]
MIYTITLNPALDRTLYVKKINYDDSIRIEKERRYAGGKGIDVSRVLTILGIDNRALGFIGGFSGEELEGRLLNKGISSDFISISGETRTNIIINDMSTKTQTVLNAKGPRITPHSLMKLIHKVENLKAPDIVTISGSLPPGVNPEIYHKIIEIAKNRGATVVLDTDGDALKVGIDAQPDVIKPNIHELSRLKGVELKEMKDIINAAKSIREQGVKIVLVSMGAKGILMISEKEGYLASPPEVMVENTIGAGDSSVAGFICGLKQGKKLKDALAFAVAAGTATTLKPGTSLCEKDVIMELIPKIKLTAV